MAESAEASVGAWGGPELVHDIEALQSLKEVLRIALVDLTQCRGSATSLSASQLPCPDLEGALADFVEAGREGHERVINCLSSAAGLAKAAAESYSQVEATLSQNMEVDG
jgi:hypothetical protein